MEKMNGSIEKTRRDPRTPTILLIISNVTVNNTANSQNPISDAGTDFLLKKNIRQIQNNPIKKNGAQILRYQYSEKGAIIIGSNFEPLSSCVNSESGSPKLLRFVDE